MDREIEQLLLQIEIAERGMAMPYDRERVRDLRNMLAEARKRKVSDRLTRMRARHQETRR